MNFILDTHTFIWYIEGNNKLSNYSLKVIENIDNKVFLSIAGLWEISIKMNLKKLKLLIKYEELNKIIRNLSIEILPITFEDTFINLKLERFHKDPFDRIIISQSINTEMPLISNDAIFDLYKIKRYW